MCDVVLSRCRCRTAWSTSLWNVPLWWMQQEPFLVNWQRCWELASALKTPLQEFQCPLSLGKGWSLTLRGILSLFLKETAPIAVKMSGFLWKGLAVPSQRSSLLFSSLIWGCFSPDPMNGVKIVTLFKCTGEIVSALTQYECEYPQTHTFKDRLYLKRTDCQTTMEIKSVSSFFSHSQRRSEKSAVLERKKWRYLF